jgi:DNA-directed RNA polymerase specialized sigma24 family protein
MRVLTNRQGAYAMTPTDEVEFIALWEPGLSQDAIAQQLGCPVGTVKSRCNRSTSTITVLAEDPHAQIEGGEQRDSLKPALFFCPLEG